MFLKDKGIFLVILVIISAVSISGQEVTHFLEPLKNITAPIGTNLEFSCSIYHLGSSRIVWFYKPVGGTTIDSILAVNGLKVTRNPKISFSVIPRSGDITESILYIFNVGSEEAGIYSCGVSTEPMILQKGTLEVTPVKEKEPTTVRTPPVSPPPKVESGKDKNSSEFFCVNFPQLWRDTKREAEKFAKDVWKKVTSLF